MTGSAARHVVESLEHGTIPHVMSLLADERKAPAENRLARWAPAMDRFVGAPRRIVEAEPASEETLVLEGPNGRLLVRVQFDNEQRLVDVELTPLVTDGILNIVIGAPETWDEERERVEGGARELALFYSGLLGTKILREDWMVIGHENQVPRVAFGDGWSDERPPRWPDPDYPHQLHLDIAVRDLEAADEAVMRAGAHLLQDGGAHRTYADPMGHPFCLYPDLSAPEGHGRIQRLVFDCADPDPLATFWAGLLDMPARLEDSSERIIIARRDGTPPDLAFQRVAHYVAPRWHDPKFPQPIHLDLMFNDHAGAKHKAEQLGATELPPPRGSCPVYADPAGHPFCLCSNGGGDEPYIAQLIG